MMTHELVDIHLDPGVMIPILFEIERDPSNELIDICLNFNYRPSITSIDIEFDYRLIKLSPCQLVFLVRCDDHYLYIKGKTSEFHMFIFFSQVNF